MSRLLQFLVSAVLLLTYPVTAFQKWRAGIRHRRLLETDAEKRRSPFTHAVLENDVASVAKALEEGTDPDTRLLDTPEFDQYPDIGYLRRAPTALVVAAHYDYREMAELLLRSGADPLARNGANRLGSDAIHSAAGAGHTEMVDLLIRSTGLVKIHGSAAESALVSAAYQGRIAVIELLLKYGADIDLVGNFDTPLTAAITMEQDTTVALLLERGANVNLAAEAGETPLMAAADFDRHAVVTPERIRIIETLLAAGADMDARDEEGRTALWWAKNPRIHAILTSTPHQKGPVP